jgi:hypothetical protein
LKMLKTMQTYQKCIFWVFIVFLLFLVFFWKIIKTWVKNWVATDGKVKLSFHQHSTSSRFSEASSSSSTRDLGRISKIPSVINIPYHANPHTKSTSDIPSTSFQNADYTTNISKPVYTDLEQPSPPTSPTF